MCRQEGQGSPTSFRGEKNVSKSEIKQEKKKKECTMFASPLTKQKKKNEREKETEKVQPACNLPLPTFLKVNNTPFLENPNSWDVS